MLLKTCKKCNSEFSVRQYRKDVAIFCSYSCSASWRWKNKQIPNYRNQLSGKKHKMWKGGIKHLHGYILIYSKDHPHKDKQGYVRQHRLVIEKHIGRYLRKDEVIHHKNGIKSDNKLSNLEIISNSEHSRIHQTKRMKVFRNMRINKTCPICQNKFSKPRSLARIKTCSRHCGAILRHR